MFFFGLPGVRSSLIPTQSLNLFTNFLEHMLHPLFSTNFRVRGNSNMQVRSVGLNLSRYNQFVGRCSGFNSVISGQSPDLNLLFIYFTDRVVVDVLVHNATAKVCGCLWPVCAVLLDLVKSQGIKR